MSQQTDELLGMFETAISPEEEAKHRQRVAQEKSDAEKRLRLLQDLRNTPGFHLYLEQLTVERMGAFNAMERNDDPTALAKHVGAYCALARASEYVTDEIAALVQMLTGAA